MHQRPLVRRGDVTVWLANERAGELNPNLPIVHRWCAYWYLTNGRVDEARAEYELTEALDPLWITSGPGSSLGSIYESVGEPERAVGYWERQMELDRSHPGPYWAVGNSYSRRGLYEVGIAALETADRIDPGNPILASDRGYCHALAGERDAALALVDALDAQSAQAYVDPLRLATIYVALGEIDEAFARLNRAYEVGSVIMVPFVWLVLGDPMFEPLRADPRFQAFLQRPLLQNAPRFMGSGTQP